VCLRLHLERGQFARLRVEAPGDDEALEVTVLAPGDSVPLVSLGVGTMPNRGLAWEARATGVHIVVLTGSRRARAVAVAVTHIDDPSTLTARRAALATDPRVAWLAERAIPIRTLDPRDTAFADLRPLKPLLSNIRVVLLGEADHGDGSDFLAKSRLIRFLHAELGFDVLAFEAGVYDMWRAWREISAGRDPMASFTQGAFWMWAQARQLESLLGYVAQVAHSPRPLVLAGIDQLPRTGKTASPDTLIAELRTFLQANGLAGPFANSPSAESELLKRMHARQYSVPDSTTLAAFEGALAATAARIERDVATDEGRYWARILRISALGAPGEGWPARRSYCETEACRNTGDRDPEMVQNLLWLANELYPGRRIIVWAHNAHIMRNPSLLESGRWAPYAMGDGVWAEFGNQSYAIAFVSYEGSHRWASVAQRPTFTIVPDQHPEPEFEELMAAAGHGIALLDLRGAVGGNTWLAQPFLARPLGHSTDRSQWGRNYDALLFIRTQEPSVAIPMP
jgi:erythromycin esterase